MATDTIEWTNSSVLAFAKGGDPIEEMERLTRDAALSAIEEGWTGPPFDPMELARIRGIEVRPNHTVADARVFLVNNVFEIEYNPHRPKGRVNFSIAHEIAHTLFEDCADEVRHRNRQKWEQRSLQLELLCNVGAAEMMMPVGSFPADDDRLTTIEDLMELRKCFEVSTEAVLIRMVKLASSRVACFSASRITDEVGTSYRVDYRIGSALWSEWASSRPKRRFVSDVLDQCVAIGTTAKGTEQWARCDPELHVEAVALPPLPGASNLRIAGITRPSFEAPIVSGIEYRQGNAAEFVASSNVAILHIVNDRARTWIARGFARSVRDTHPTSFEDYRKWATEHPEERTLGAVHIADLGGKRYVVSLVAQHGYGKSTGPRVRYGALDFALFKARKRLLKMGVRIVQMPRIGTGQAGGNWQVIEGLLLERLVSSGIVVRVFDLPPR